MALAATALVLSGRRPVTVAGALRHVPLLQKALALVQQSEPRLTRDLRLLLRSTTFQIAIILLDAATVWVLIRSLGATAPAPEVFASFVISTLFRKNGLVPGGLGTFEAASVVTLTLAGVPVAIALSATLLFRGFSFWLPLLPGLWVSRGTMGRARPPESA